MAVLLCVHHLDYDLLLLVFPLLALVYRRVPGLLEDRRARGVTLGLFAILGLNYVSTQSVLDRFALQPATALLLVSINSVVLLLIFTMYAARRRGCANARCTRAGSTYRETDDSCSGSAIGAVRARRRKATPATVPMSVPAPPFAPRGTSGARAAISSDGSSAVSSGRSRVALVVPVWMGSHFPSEDGLAHLGVDRGLPGARRGRFGMATVLRAERALEYAEPRPISDSQYALGAFVEPHLAQRLIISALIVGWAASIHALSLALEGRISLGAFASLVLIQSSWLYGGYLSFYWRAAPAARAGAGRANGGSSVDSAAAWELALLSLLGVSRTTRTS